MIQDVFGIIGTTLAGTFLVEEVIAEGGFGVVYRAEHVAFRAPVALKCLKIPGTINQDQSETFIENFREEAEILFHLSAQIPEVVRPLHADAMTLQDGTFVPYIAMEWVEGKPLDSIVILRDQDGLPPLSLRKVIKMLTPIAHALHRAHRFEVPGGGVVSITHCDMKPENIVIVDQGNVRAKILDFGIAKARDMVRQNVGRCTESEGTSPFTPAYGAPEQWVPKRFGQSGPWTDVWGLALTMVECLSGQPPIDGDMHAMMGTALDLNRRPSPRNEGVDVSDQVEAVFRRALAVDPRDRYQDVATFWTELEHAFGVPSSFARVEQRRGRRTYDTDDLESEHPPARDDDAPALGGVPPARDRLDSFNSLVVGGGGSGRFDEFDSDEFDLAADGNAADLDAPGTPLRESESSGRFDLDLGPPGSVGSAPGSGRHGALRSDSFASAGSMSASGSFNRPPARPAPLRAVPSPAARDLARAGGVSEARELRSSLKMPIILVALGVGLTVADMALGRAVSEAIQLGPIKLRWIAAALAGIGIVLAFVGLVGKDSDEE